MFYVSKIVNRNVYVTDTADGVEELVRISDIQKLLKSGIEIKGCRLKPTERGTAVVSTVYPYSNSALTSKMRLIAGLNIVVDGNGCLRKLALSSDEDFADELILSRYCKSVGTSSLMTKGTSSGRVLSLIFDDSIEYVDSRFIDAFPINQIVINLSSVNNEELVDSIYDAVFYATRHNKYVISGNFVDKQNRFRLKAIEYLLKYTASSIFLHDVFFDFYSAVGCPISKDVDEYLENRGVVKKLASSIKKGTRFADDNFISHYAPVLETTFSKFINMSPVISRPNNWYQNHKMFVELHMLGTHLVNMSEMSFHRLTLYICLGGRNEEVVSNYLSLLERLADELHARQGGKNG